MNESVDGEFQRYAVESGAYAREHFFGGDPRLRKLVDHLSDEEIRNLPRGGHDYRKLYAAYKAATEQPGAPTVILAKTIKGWTLGPDVEGRNATHQIKKMTTDQLLLLRERLHLQEEVPEDALGDGKEPPYISLPDDSEIRQYMDGRRLALDGSLPRRVVRTKRKLDLPASGAFDEVLAGSGKQAASTTTAFTRLLRNLCRDKKFGPRVVPIIPDEARTFGMDSLFKEFGIYASQGQHYEPVDHALLLSYKESQDGQILEEGITEAGGLASFIAAGTSYATQGVPMVPFFTFYSMFGWQRVGDLIWQASDARARGFLLGATAGRTTLLGEGLQHQDGHSLLLASVNPAAEAYDPAFAYEVATIVRHGLQRMWVDNEDVIYYLTLYNENQVMPAMPEDAEPGVIEGLYRWSTGPDGPKHRATILFSGSANLAVREAQTQLAEHYDVSAELFSATSYKRMREQALSTERWNRLHPGQPARTPRVTELLDGDGPVIAVTDFMKAVPDQIARWVPQDRSFTPLGTDGFGRSDTREALRRHFEIDAPHVVAATLAALAAAGEVKPELVQDAIDRYELDPERIDPRLA
jgi:pyruvate dehydrogenase E1 component